MTAQDHKKTAKKPRPKEGAASKEEAATPKVRAKAAKPKTAKGKRPKAPKAPTEFVNFGKARPFKTPVFSEGQVERKWWVIDLNEKILGRAATTISLLLRGKHKPNFTPLADTGDFVVAINARKVRLTGEKWKQRAFQ